MKFIMFSHCSTAYQNCIRNYLSRIDLRQKIRVDERFRTTLMYWIIKINSFQTFYIFENFHVECDLRRQKTTFHSYGWKVKQNCYCHRPHKTWKIICKCNRSLVEISDSMQLRNQLEILELTKILLDFLSRPLELTF